MSKNARDHIIQKIQASSGTVVAKEAKVSPTTIALLVKDYISSLEKEKPYAKNKLKDWNKKKSLGLISSLVKLARWAGLSPEKLVSCYPIPYDKQVIEGWIKEAEQRIFPTYELFANKKIANLPFEPFNLRGSDGLQWGERFSLRLLKGIDPSWDSVIKPYKFDEDLLIQQLNEPNTQNRLDLLFGLFRSSKRVAHQVGFVDIPGIRIKLGMLSNVPLTWRDIETASYRGLNIKFITITGYVSESYLSACCFNKGEISTIPTLENIPTSQSSWLALASSLKEKIEQILSTEECEIFCFVCSANIIGKVEYHLKKMGLEEKHDISKYRLPRTIPKDFDLQHQDITSHFSEYAPSYQACIALNPHSNNLTIESAWYALFNTMFVNGIYLTAEEYIDLLMGDLEANGFLSIHFKNNDRQIPPSQWRHFLGVCRECLETRINYYSDQENPSEDYLGKRTLNLQKLKILNQLFNYKIDLVK